MIRVFVADTKEKKAAALFVRRRVFVSEQNVSLEADVEGDEEATHFVVEKEGMPVGAGRFRVKGSFLKFERIATLSQARGKGVATALMLFMQAYGKELYPHLLQILHAQIDALLFYQKLGWVALGPEFQEEGITHRLLFRPPTDKEKNNLACLKDPTCPPIIKAAL